MSRDLKGAAKKIVRGSEEGNLPNSLSEILDGDEQPTDTETRINGDTEIRISVDTDHPKYKRKEFLFPWNFNEDFEDFCHEFRRKNQTAEVLEALTEHMKRKRKALAKKT